MIIISSLKSGDKIRYVNHDGYVWYYIFLSFLEDNWLCVLGLNNNRIMKIMNFSSLEVI
jgi:hypothetical protein